MNQLDRNSLPIGIFDSGMGGLTVLNELVKELPNESFIYLGDTARLPYGTKSQQTVLHYAIQMTNLLIQQNIKLLVIACNTATTAALPQLKLLFPDIPILGVIEPGAHLAAATTKNNKVAVLATETTINSGVYQNTLQHLNPIIQVITQSCGLFVALAEEGSVDDELAYVAVNKYLIPIKQVLEDCDCLILGCTHFPVLIKPIQQALHNNITIINSAQATAKKIATVLQEVNLENSADNQQIKFLVTDLPERFARIGEIFFKRTILPSTVSLIDVETSAIMLKKELQPL
ncbi:MAG: glutamate racemase [Gammaproteobacteria bacterium RIFCSPHIGHO2_12_FULL_35_23]|nr:MAG: glutamate racemase [Gammaproteobacteria bacterium RIFCSPHIGHO2_12_FULL_35_23]